MKRGTEKFSYLNLVIVLTILVSIGMMIWIAYLITTDGAKCIVSPLTYGVKQLEERNNEQLMCSCNLLKQGSATLFFNSQNISLKVQGVNEYYEDINYSRLKEQLSSKN